jgi:hypothetical protein
LICMTLKTTPLEPFPIRFLDLNLFAASASHIDAYH